LLVEDFPSGRFVTMVYAVLDSQQSTFTYANAGHLPPLLVDASGAQLLQTDMGLPLGIRNGTYSEKTLALQGKFRVALYSDGITEAANPREEEYGTKRLVEFVQRAEACPEHLIEDVRAFASGAGLRDDATVIMLRRE